MKSILRARQVVPAEGGIYLVTECGRLFFQSTPTSSLHMSPVVESRWVEVKCPSVDVPPPPPPPPAPPPTVF